MSTKLAIAWTLIAVTGGGKINVVVDYMGSATPPPDDSSPVRPLTAQPYAPPLLSLVSDRGDITVLGCGGAPTNASFANVASLYGDSQLGNVKIEINGDGLNAAQVPKPHTGMPLVPKKFLTFLSGAMSFTFRW